MTNRYTKIYSTLSNNGKIILDGGVSTELERRGVPMRDAVWSGHASIDAWDILVETHRAYIDAGSNIITANTYASSRLMLESTNYGNQVEEINLKSLEAAHTARERSGTPDVLIAGSISHTLPFADGAEGANQQPDIPIDVLRHAYDEMVSFHEKGEADLILLEMMSLPQRMIPLFDVASESNLPVWCGLAAKRTTQDSPITAWHDEAIMFSENVKIASYYGFNVLGAMHTSADLISDTLPILKTEHSGPIMVYPDSGFFKAPNWQFVNVLSPLEFRNFAKDWFAQGAQIIGGCCGLEPKHIAAISDL